MPAYSDSTQPSPFVKWAGGKGQLLPQLEPLYPRGSLLTRYLEPFVGSGAVFFDIRRRFRLGQAILADGNEDLINLYRAVKDDVETVIKLLGRHKTSHGPDHYYKVRAQDPRRLTAASRAARMLYLNKTCFNGLYRVNSKGEFNVPMGRYVDPPILDAENLRAAAAVLDAVDLRLAHFTQTPGYAARGDFVYFDPPYHPVTSTSYFTSYTQGAFTASDQEALADVYTQLSSRGCRVMLSNSDCSFIRGLYRRFDVRTVRARRSINSRADRRGLVSEVVVLNYTPRGAQAAALAGRRSVRSSSQRAQG
ncbi:MAG TPA: DNA adenine methylase [Candidatus Polarisedimenticolia bacterium]|nr:DNA adenine methylase [Candidatus Polarisedimenticolia bacterium]